MEPFQTKSGATIVITAAPWRDAKALKKAIEREMAMSGTVSIPSVLLVDSSDAVDAALWPCLARCLYNNEKITETTFNNVDARQDYYEIVVACVKENLGPLAEGLLSKLSEYGLITKQAITGNGLKSKSPMTSASQPSDSQNPVISEETRKAS